MQTIEVPRRYAIWMVVGTCILSAAIGSGITLLAQSGPTGPQGEQGPAGPRGPEGPEGFVETEDLGFLESEVEELAGELGDAGELESRINDLEFDLSRTESSVSDLCFELDLFC
jgi:hypothetical protein